MMSKIDSHVHFWQLSRGDYHWLTSDMQAIQRDFGPEDFETGKNNNNVSQIILVQAAPTSDETRYIIDVARQCDFVTAVIGKVDIENADAALDQLHEFAAYPLFRGIRPRLVNMGENSWLKLPQLDETVRGLLQLDLSFECMVLPHEINDLTNWLNKYPGLRTVLSHAGMPDIAHDGFDYWADKIKHIATETHVHCKLSGLTTLASRDWNTETLRPYFEQLLSCFGYERLIWGSDWPVMLCGGNYDDWCTVCDELLQGLNENMRQAIYADNAKKFYRLDE